MKYGMYVMRDTKVGYLQPMMDQNDATAMRNFRHAVLQPGVMHTHPQDFELFRIGDFDSDSGLVTSLPAPQFLMSGVGEADV